MLEKGKLYYIIVNNDIEPVELIEVYNSQYVRVKNLNINEEDLIAHYYVYNNKEQAYTKLLGWLEDNKLEAEEGIKDLEEDLNRINEAIKKLKQKYEQ